MISLIEGGKENRNQQLTFVHYPPCVRHSYIETIIYFTMDYHHSMRHYYYTYFRDGKTETCTRSWGWAAARLGLEFTFDTKAYILFATKCSINLPNGTLGVNWIVSMLKQAYLIVNAWLEYHLGTSSDHQMEGKSNLRNSFKNFPRPVTKNTLTNRNCTMLSRSYFVSLSISKNSSRMRVWAPGTISS